MADDLDVAALLATVAPGFRNTASRFRTTEALQRQLLQERYPFWQADPLLALYDALARGDDARKDALLTLYDYQALFNEPHDDLSEVIDLVQVLFSMDDVATLRRLGRATISKVLSKGGLKFAQYFGTESWNWYTNQPLDQAILPRDQFYFDKLLLPVPDGEDIHTRRAYSLLGNNPEGLGTGYYLPGHWIRFALNELSSATIKDEDYEDVLSIYRQVVVTSMTPYYVFEYLKLAPWGNEVWPYSRVIQALNPNQLLWFRGTFPLLERWTERYAPFLIPAPRRRYPDEGMGEDYRLP